MFLYFLFLFKNLFNRAIQLYLPSFPNLFHDGLSQLLDYFPVLFSRNYCLSILYITSLHLLIPNYKMLLLKVRALELSTCPWGVP